MPEIHCLYLNLWGVTSKHLGSNGVTGRPPESETRFFPADDLVRCQTTFRKVLRSSIGASGIEVEPAIDFAYAFSSDLSELVAYAIRVFEKMADVEVSPQDHRIWPIRGAIASGCHRLNMDGDQAVSWVGPGPTIAAELEKSAQKGMRLLVTRSTWESSGSSLNGVVYREFAVRGHTHFEVNWAANRISLLDERVIAELMEIGTNYSQQLAASLAGLKRWLMTVKSTVETSLKQTNDVRGRDHR